jgi:hypothetical protein
MVPLHDVRMITIQFSFTNPDAIPTTVKQLERETVLEHVARKLQATGERVIEPTENCSLEFLGELGAVGFELVDALYQKRVDGGDPNRTYHMVRFLFSRNEFASVSEPFALVRDNVRVELRKMLSAAFWRVRAFLNPFYQNGEEIAGQRALSINLEVRVPLYQPDGQPVTARPKDASGKRVGTPQPLTPDFRLAVVGDTIRLLAHDRGQPNSG